MITNDTQHYKWIQCYLTKWLIPMNIIIQHLLVRVYVSTLIRVQIHYSICMRFTTFWTEINK
jgi:hypothetical protein